MNGTHTQAGIVEEAFGPVGSVGWSASLAG